MRFILQIWLLRAELRMLLFLKELQPIRLHIRSLLRLRSLQTQGSLTVGKDATLFLSLGDALDMRTNQLTHAFVEGRALSLETHQTELWKRYMEKYSRK